MKHKAVSWGSLLSVHPHLNRKNCIKIFKLAHTTQGTPFLLLNLLDLPVVFSIMIYYFSLFLPEEKNAIDIPLSVQPKLLLNCPSLVIQ